MQTKITVVRLGAGLVHKPTYQVTNLQGRTEPSIGTLLNPRELEKLIRTEPKNTVMVKN